MLDSTLHAHSWEQELAELQTWKIISQCWKCLRYEKSAQSSGRKLPLLSLNTCREEQAMLEMAPYLGKHGLPVLGDHRTLVTVHCDGWVVVRLLWVFENVIQVSHPSFKHSAKVAGDEGPADSWERNTTNKKWMKKSGWSHTPHTIARPATGYKSSREMMPGGKFLFTNSHDPSGL